MNGHVRLLVAGGARDPNLRAVLDAAQRLGIETCSLLGGSSPPPVLAWDLESDSLHVDGRPLVPHAVFLRPDAFFEKTRGAAFRAGGWHQTLQGWLAAHPQVRSLNRAALGHRTNKAHVLMLARDHGLQIPRTLLSNDLREIERFGGDAVVKPITGGGYCRTLEDALSETEERQGRAPVPALVQSRIHGPDVRVFVLGARCFAFRIDSDQLDYRTNPSARIDLYEEGLEDVLPGLRSLMAALDLEWGAADFKRGPTGELVFLEINSGPMFSAFDRPAGGRVSEALVEELCGEELACCDAGGILPACCNVL